MRVSQVRDLHVNGVIGVDAPDGPVEGQLRQQRILNVDGRTEAVSLTLVELEGDSAAVSAQSLVHFLCLRGRHHRVCSAL